MDVFRETLNYLMFTQFSVAHLKFMKFAFVVSQVNEVKCKFLYKHLLQIYLFIKFIVAFLN